MRRRDLTSYDLVYKTSALEPVELRRKIGGLGGSQTLTRSLQDFYALGYITSPKLIWWLWVDSNHQPRAYETLALPLELHSQMQG